MIAATLWVTPRIVQADITNVIWQAQIAGKLAIQQYDSKLQPRIGTAKFKTSTFISMITGSTPGAGSTASPIIAGANGTATTTEYLGFNIVIVGGQNNFYLSVYDSSIRANSLRITTNEVTTWVTDGKNLTFTVEAPMLTTNSTWGGGFIRIAGTGQMVKGIPARLTGAVDGMVVDNRPGDLHGTTGLVMQARISTSKAPFRVQPSK